MMSLGAALMFSIITQSLHLGRAYGPDHSGVSEKEQYSLGPGCTARDNQPDTVPRGHKGEVVRRIQADP